MAVWNCAVENDQVECGMTTQRRMEVAHGVKDLESFAADTVHKSMVAAPVDVVRRERTEDECGMMTQQRMEGAHGVKDP